MPRRPSAGVKQRIFARSVAGEARLTRDASRNGCGAVAAEPAPFRLGWFAPTTVSLLLACVLVNQHNSFILSDSAGTGPMVAAALSNQSVAAWLPGSFEHSQNSLPLDALDWTNRSKRASSSGLGGKD